MSRTNAVTVLVDDRTFELIERLRGKEPRSPFLLRMIRGGLKLEGRGLIEDE